MRLEGKTAVITGGAKGIGKATALLFSREGANVVIADIDSAAGHEVVADIIENGGQAIFAYTDVTDIDQVERMMDLAEQEYGKIDVLFNNAGIALFIPTTEMSEQQWKSFMDINLNSVFYGCKCAIPRMIKNQGGVIINCASIHGHVAGPMITAYATSKGGVVMMTKALAAEYANLNIRVNAICPGYVKTPMILDIRDEMGEHGSAMEAHLCSQHPMGRLAEPEEIASAVLFMASDESSFMTGSSLVIDGGYTAV